MVNLPNSNFKYLALGDKDEFVQNALKTRKHYDTCWCGSGKKFKKCHMLREDQEPYTSERLGHLSRSIFWKKRACMHPSASPNTCIGPAIDSHTIQKKGPLKKIIDSTGHVMSFESNYKTLEIEMQKIGWKKASVFPGYCSKHDSELFSPLESNPFFGEHKLCVLQAYRSLCNELYKKQALIEVFENSRNYIDRGMNLDLQIHHQRSLQHNIQNQLKTVKENNALRTKFEYAIRNDRYEIFKSKVYFFKGNLSVVSSSSVAPEFDFNGKKLFDLWDMTLDAEILSHAILDTPSGGAVVFVWVAGEKIPCSVVESFSSISDIYKGDAFAKYSFLATENTYFSKKWWETLSVNSRQSIESYARSLYYDGGSLAISGSKLVDWVFE